MELTVLIYIYQFFNSTQFVEIKKWNVKEEVSVPVTNYLHSWYILILLWKLSMCKLLLTMKAQSQSNIIFTLTAVKYTCAFTLQNCWLIIIKRLVQALKAHVTKFFKHI